MHVAGVTLDLNWFVQFVFTLFIIAVGLLHLVKNTASKYFEVDANFEAGTAGAETVGRNSMPGIPMDNPVCAVCGKSGSKKCSRCKAVRYCSIECQGVHWKSGHKTSCKVVKNIAQNSSDDYGSKNSGGGDKSLTGIALIPAFGSGIPKSIKKAKEILFPYDEFVKLFNWNKPGFRPCGLINCGNSCFANVVLQCLASTRPLVAYLLDEGHRRECVRDDWCFLCEFQSHLERASQSSQAFSPMNIISRLPNIGGNLGYGRQEDAHEFMRLAIDTMQSVCLDVFGGEKAVPSKSQETTIIQHIFGGHLQSQVICTVCNNVSNQYENMMDLTVEIHGEASSLEECLDQFTVKECLHGENMYKCDGCNDYVKAWKRLTVKRAPNILTIALKRFQSGRFGKLNKRIAFPEMLDLSPYMSEASNDPDIYKLYAVVVHIDMLNASFFGHYICYTKDFRGNWYRIDDCKVINVELEEVLSQGAYMLFYSRVQAQPACLKAPDPSKEQEMVNGEVEPCPNGKVETSTPNNCVEAVFSSGSLLYDGTGPFPGSHERETLAEDSLEAVRENVKDTDVATSISVFSTPREVSCFDRALWTEQEVDINVNGFESGPSASNGSDEVYGVGTKLGTLRQDSKDVLEDYLMEHVEVANNESCQVVSEEISRCDSKELSVSNGEFIKEDSEDTYIADCDSALNIKDVAICGNGHAHTDDIASKVNSDAFPYSREMYQAQIGDSKHGLSIHSTNFIGGNGVGGLEAMGKSL